MWPRLVQRAHQQGDRGVRQRQDGRFAASARSEVCGTDAGAARNLEKRGVLSPEEIHKLASKTKKAVANDDGKASCHSDYVDDGAAERIQAERLVQLRQKSASSRRNERGALGRWAADRRRRAISDEKRPCVREAVLRRFAPAVPLW